MKKYGVTHNMQIPEVKANLSKYRIKNRLAAGENNPCFGLKGKNHPASKAKQEKHKQILEFFSTKPYLKHGYIGKNGKVVTYERAFSNEYSSIFNITAAGLYNIVKSSIWAES
jgi:hypothetical protein